MEMDVQGVTERKETGFVQTSKCTECGRCGEAWEVKGGLGV